MAQRITPEKIEELYRLMQETFAPDDYIAHQAYNKALIKTQAETGVSCEEIEALVEKRAWG